ncbi:MAG TPA: c-type cytochrome [Vicinamibacterales bacterium]|nr:c-type cytochrome [Vicinamibacterales bacterium]
MRRILWVMAAGLAAVVSLHAQTQNPIPEKFTNLQVLPKDTTRQNLVPIMRGFALNLGTRCVNCHVYSGSDPAGNDLSKFDFASDAKPGKATARKMMRMVTAINDDLLKGVGDPAPAGTQKVTCYTCHRGALKPLTAPGL